VQQSPLMINNIGLFLGKRAALNPALEAVVEPDTGRRFTYRELDRRCNRVANALRGAGVAKGDRVGLLMMNGVEFVESFMAIAKIGAVVVPLNWRLVPDELEFILKDSGTRTLVYGHEFTGPVTELHERGDRTDIVDWVQLGGDTAPFAVGYDDWTTSAADDAPEIAGADDDHLFIMYTSGTTGLPKGVVHTHNTVMWALLTIAATADIRFRDVYLVSLPLFHVGALAPALGNIYKGATMVVPRGFDPKQTWELFASERVTSGLLVPAMLQFMLAVHRPDEHDAATVRWVMSGAAPVPVTLIKAYEGLGVEVHQVYGLTESGGPACLIAPDEALARAGSTGKAFFHTEVKLVREDGSTCGPDEAGEVLVKGPHIMREYWNRPEATAITIVDGWLHTGDVATMDADGFVTIMDRVKDMLISGGENVYPAEIENVLLGNPKVADAAVIGVPSEKWGESPLAIIVRRDPTLTEDEVIAGCAGRLAPYKMVKAVQFVDEIPRNPSGKILKRVLREQFPEVTTT
jgi:acyl-CoA synthetase (AMP-forming)/AMP-acid ligase II